MKKLFLFFTIAGFFASCEKTGEIIIDDDDLVIEETGEITVSLMERDDYAIFDKTVILFENENYLIKTPLYYFLNNLSYLSDLFLDYNSYLSTFEKIVSAGKTNNLLYSSLYFGDKPDYVLAGFLTPGLCYVYDKKNESKVKQIVIEYWKYSSESTNPEKRRFYIDNVLFLETTGSFTAYKKNDDRIIRGNIEEEVTVPLIDRDDYAIFDKTVILFENENYLVKTPLIYFLSNMDNSYFFIRCDEYLTSLEKVLSDGKTNDRLYSSSYFDKHRINYVLAGFLETGLCYVYDKKKKNNVKQIVVAYWGYSPAPLAGAGGRKFYINNDVFLEILDWIS